MQKSLRDGLRAMLAASSRAKSLTAAPPAPTTLLCVHAAPGLGLRTVGPAHSLPFPPDKSWISHAEDSILGTFIEPIQPLISRGGRKPGSHSFSVRWVELGAQPCSSTSRILRQRTPPDGSLVEQETSKSFTTKMNSITPHANCEDLDTKAPDSSSTLIQVENGVSKASLIYQLSNGLTIGNFLPFPQKPIPTGSVVVELLLSMHHTSHHSLNLS